MLRRRLVYATITIMLLAGFILTQFRIQPDARPIAEPGDIAKMALDSDLNVLFLLVDTLRADRLGTYGYERPTSPAIDKLAKTGVRFANHFSQSSWTKTSMASLWTASYPNRTGILRFDHALPESAVLPAELLQDSGFVTAGIWRNGWVAPTFGFEQGFDIYHRPEVGAPIDSIRRETKNPYAKLAGSDQDATDGVIEFLRAYQNDRFMLYVHMMDAHQYLSDEESAVFGTTYSDLYDNSILWTDRQISTIVDALEHFGLRENTLIVIASDHGEAFQEHGNEGHAKDLHSEVARTPLILSFPFSLEEPVVVEAMSENVDIWPTIFDLLGEVPMDSADGRSRFPEILAAAGGAGEAGDGPVPEAQPGYAQLDRSWGKASKDSENLIAVTVGDWRYMRGFGKRSGAKLYDTAADPAEMKDLLAEGGVPLDVQQFDALIEAYLALPEPAWLKDVGNVELDDMQKGQLRAIGYSIE